MAHAVLTGFATIGRECHIHYGAVIGHEPQDLSFDGASTRAVVGDRTIVREYATVHRATREGGATVVGEDCYLMAHSHVAHDCRIGNKAILCNSALVAGHCEVGERAFLSGNTVVHQFCRVGRCVMLSGGSGIGRDIGPFLTVAGRSEVVGFNSVGMRRAGLDAAARHRVKEAYGLLFGAPSLEEGCARIAEMGPDHEETAEILEFFRRTRRGFSRPPAGHILSEAVDG
jgi:UDP-N-acetylglucosamine acyltransferase